MLYLLDQNPACLGAQILSATKNYSVQEGQVMSRLWIPDLKLLQSKHNFESRDGPELRH